MLTRYQQKRVIAQLKRVRKFIKLDAFEHPLSDFDNTARLHGINLIDNCIGIVLDESVSHTRTKPLPPRVWKERK